VHIRVWVDAWQMQCCGTPFSDGGTVEWTLSSESDLDWMVSVVGREVAVTIDYSEDHRGGLPEETPTTAGVISRIQAVRCRFAAAPEGDSKVLYPVPGSGQVAVVHSADGWDAESDELRFNGYLVDLTVDGT
jgi:hypothetical protein